MSGTEREQLLAAARAYLEWEAELTGCGLPELASPTASWQAASSPAASPPTASQPSISPPAPTLSGPAADGPAVLLREQAAARAPSGGSAVAPSPELAPTGRAGAVHATTAPPALGQGPGLPASGEPSGDKRVRLTQLETAVRACTRCELAKGRTQTVFARGNPDSPLLFIGEGPGQEEDRLGVPFVGPAGQLLDRMIAAMGFGRDDVYICNVVKCRPPGNRTPLPSEAGACGSYLLGQLEAVRPRAIVALGRCAAENLGLVEGGSWRGRWGKFHGIDVMPTYHPAFLLRSPEFKRPVWEDLQKVMTRLKASG